MGRAKCFMPNRFSRTRQVMRTNERVDYIGKEIEEILNKKVGARGMDKKFRSVG